MSTENKSDETKEGETPAAPKPSAIGGLLKVLVPAILAAAAAYGGTRGAAARAPAASASHEGGGGGYGDRPPGPTLALDPFLVTIFDANRKPHPMKLSVALEFDPYSKAETKTFTPRIRDAILSHVRTLSHEQVIDSAYSDKFRTELLEKIRASGVHSAERVFVTDFVVQ